jgi:hypothetical protein
MLEEVHEDIQSSLALELRKMNERTHITITSTQRNKTQREEKIDECRKKRLGGMQNFVKVTKNLHPQTFGRGATNLVNGTILTHYR